LSREREPVPPRVKRTDLRHGRRRGLRVLAVDDDDGILLLLRTTLATAELEVDVANDVETARACIARRHPDVIILDVNMPGLGGIEFCDELKSNPRTAGIAIALLTGSARTDLGAHGADAILKKPFSPLELLSLVERLAGGLTGVPLRSPSPGDSNADALLLYARDLRHVLEVERAQRHALESAYLETVATIAAALETRDGSTRAHSQRVQRYATELAREVSPRLLAGTSAEYGFLLHDVGKIGIPDAILQKPGPLTPPERKRMQSHAVLGHQILAGVASLQGEGIRVVRSHHERWDGTGYPDRLAGRKIPLAARIFSVADTLDAMTSNRPYRRALAWKTAREEIVRQAGSQFDPDVVAAFEVLEPELHEIRRELAAAA
jgi:response regulator RpfG family c-di-GMP phosphodiesterase